MACRPPYGHGPPPARFAPQEVGELTHVVLSTVSTDYQVGALAELDLAQGLVEDALTGLSGDPYVQVDDGVLLQINSHHSDSVRVYELGRYAAPRVEFSVGTGATPADAALCGPEGEVWVSLLDGDALVVVAASSGEELARLSLVDWADSDGRAEPGDVVVEGGTLFVALQHLDRANGWASSEGLVLGVDCATRAVVAEVATGPNPSLVRGATPGLLWVRTGVYYQDGQPLFDGELRPLDTALALAGAPALGPAALTEADLQRNLTDLAVGPDGDAVLLVADAMDRYGWATVGLGPSEAMDEAVSPPVVCSEPTDDFLTDVAIDDLGRAWITGRPGWTDPHSEGGVRVVWSDDGTPALDEPIPTWLPPFRVDLR